MADETILVTSHIDGPIFLDRSSGKEWSFFFFDVAGILAHIATPPQTDVLRRRARIDMSEPRGRGRDRQLSWGTALPFAVRKQRRLLANRSATGISQIELDNE